LAAFFRQILPGCTRAAIEVHCLLSHVVVPNFAHIVGNEQHSFDAVVGRREDTSDRLAWTNRHAIKYKFANHYGFGTYDPVRQGAYART